MDDNDCDSAANARNYAAAPLCDGGLGNDCDDRHPALDGVIRDGDGPGTMVTNAEGLEHFRQLAGVEDGDRWQEWCRQHVEDVGDGLLMVRV